MTPMAAGPVQRRQSFWDRIFTKVKRMLGGRGKREEERGRKREREIEIGAPYGFQHHSTGGGSGLRPSVEN